MGSSISLSRFVVVWASLSCVHLWLSLWNSWGRRAHKVLKLPLIAMASEFEQRSFVISLYRHSVRLVLQVSFGLSAAESRALPEACVGY